MPDKPKLTPEQKSEISLHYSMGMPASEIARQYDVHATTVRRVLRTLGVPVMRSPLSRRGARKLSPSEEKEVVEAAVSGITQEDIAKVMSISDVTVRSILRRHGVRTGQRKKISDKDAAAIRGAYEQGSTLKNLAEAYGVGASTIKRAVLRAGGRLRGRVSHFEVGRPRVWLQKIPPEEAGYLAQLYREGRPLDEIAAMFEVHRGTVIQTLHRYGYEVRGYEKRNKGEHVITGLEPQLVEDYLSGMTERQLVQKYAITPREVREAIDRHFGAWMRKAENPGSNVSTGLLAAASLTALAIGVWGWARSLR